MKTNKKLLLGLVALCAAGGIASAVALATVNANGSITNDVEGAIYLHWGETESLTDISGLKDGEYVIQTVSVSPANTSTGVTGSQVLEFTLTPDEGKYMTGITLEVGKQEDASDKLLTVAGDATQTSDSLRLPLDEDSTFYVKISFNRNVASPQPSGYLDVSLTYSETTIA